MELRTIVDEFTAKLAALIDAATEQRAGQALVGAFGSGGTQAARPGRRTKASVAAVPVRRRRKKAPRQLCPVPGCKNPAAPVFGMVCSAHKGIAKSKIRKFREKRRAAKLAAA